MPTKTKTSRTRSKTSKKKAQNKAQKKGRELIRPSEKTIETIREAVFKIATKYQCDESKNKLIALWRIGKKINLNVKNSRAIGKILIEELTKDRDDGTPKLISRGYLDRARCLARKFSREQIYKLARSNVPVSYVLPVAAPKKRINAFNATYALLTEAAKPKKKRDFRKVLLELGAVPPAIPRKWSMLPPHKRKGNESVALSASNVKASIYKRVLSVKEHAKIESNDELINSTFGILVRNKVVMSYLRNAKNGKDFEKRLERLLTEGAKALKLSY